MNKTTLIYKDLLVVHVIKKTLKNSYVSVHIDGSILLKTPKISQSYAEKILSQKEPWLRKKILELQKQTPLEIKLGEEILLFAEVCSIHNPELSILKQRLQKNSINSQEKIAKCYDSFYKEGANSHITSRVEYFSKLMNLEYSSIKFRKMRSRWGSCSSKKVLTFNTELMKVKKELIDYVVVHELAHLKHMNHSAQFHYFVEEHLLNAKKHRTELKKIRLATF